MKSQRFIILTSVLCVTILLGGGAVTHAGEPQSNSVDEMSKVNTGIEYLSYSISGSSTAAASTAANITISVNDSSNGEYNATTPILIKTEQSETVPTDFPGTNAQHTAIDTNGGGIKLGELRTAVNSWNANGKVGDGVGINLGELRNIVDYWNST